MSQWFELNFRLYGTKWLLIQWKHELRYEDRMEWDWWAAQRKHGEELANEIHRRRAQEREPTPTDEQATWWPDNTCVRTTSGHGVPPPGTKNKFCGLTPRQRYGLGHTRS